MSQLTSDSRKQKLSKWYKIGIAGLVCLVVSPIIFMVVKGLIGLLIAAAIGLVGVNLAPWFSMKLATWSLKLIKQDAMENPVETRQQIEMETEKKLVECRDGIETFAAEIMNFGNKVKDIERKYPEKAKQYIEQYNAMKALLELRRNAWHQARSELMLYKEETKEISDLWDMAQAAVRMGKLAGSMKNNPMDELRTRVANDAVHRKMNLAMSQLGTALMEETPVLQLDVADPQTIAVATLKSGVYQNVPINR